MVFKNATIAYYYIYITSYRHTILVEKKYNEKFFVRYMEVMGYATLYNFFLPMGNLLFFYQPPRRFCRSCDGLAVSSRYTRTLSWVFSEVFRVHFETFTNVVRSVYDNICE